MGLSEWFQLGLFIAVVLAIVGVYLLVRSHEQRLKNRADELRDQRDDFVDRLRRKL